MASPSISMSLPPRHDTFLSVFTKHQLRPNPKPTSLEKISVANQTAVITGGNIGIGLESARILLSRNLSHLILAVRSVDKGKEAADHLHKLYPLARIDVWHLDLNSYESIRSFARQCLDLPRLDIAILSAGIMNTSLKTSPSTGHEEMFQVNYLSIALLALLLLPALKNKKLSDAPPGRLTMVASGAALIAEFSERNEIPLLPAFSKQGAQKWNSSAAKKRYDTSKGLVLMLVYTLSKMVKAEDVVINVVDPSFTPGTSFFRNIPLLMRIFLYPITMLVGTSVNNAAWRYIDAAVGRGQEIHGSFLSDWEISPLNAFMYTEEGSKFMTRLWDETTQELDFPEVREVLKSLQDSPAA